jgi:RNA polymerase sigma factor (sigma-70 family)
MSDAEAVPEPQGEAPGLFPATAWTLVQRAVSGADGQQAARNELLERYWRPIYIYLRRGGRPAAEAEDLIQAFFVHLLEKQLLERVRLRQVRFRAYLRSVLNHFLANEARTAAAQKRRGGISLDFASVESWLAGSPHESPEAAYDRMWAVERLQAAVARLRGELSSAGRGWIADALVQRSNLGETPSAPSVKELAARHGVTENQLSVALHRARERLRQLILDEIRDSVSSPDEATDELNSLFAALRGRSP